MKNILKILFVFAVSGLLLTSCMGGGNSGSSDLGELAGENANNIFSVDSKKASFLFEQLEKTSYLNDTEKLTEEQKVEISKVKDVLSKMKNVNLGVSMILANSSDNGEKAPYSIVASNLDSETLTFVKDFKEGFKTASKSENPEADLEKIMQDSKSLSEILSSGKKVGSNLKALAESENNSTEAKTMIKIVENITVSDSSVKVSIPSELEDVKLTGLAKNNPTYKELLKNSNKTDFIKVFLSDAMVSELTESLKSGGIEKNITAVLAGVTLEKELIDLKLVAKMESKLTSEEFKKVEALVENMNASISQGLGMMAMFALSAASEEDKKVISDFITKLKFVAEKVSDDTVSVELKVESDLEKLISTLDNIQKAQQAKQAEMMNSVEPLDSMEELDFSEEL